jgi:hypothetical protein
MVGHVNRQSSHGSRFVTTSWRGNLPSVHVVFVLQSSEYFCGTRIVDSKAQCVVCIDL